MSLFGGEKLGVEELQETLREIVDGAVREALGDTNDVLRRARTVRKLQEDINDLEIDKSKRNEQYDRREREVEHKVGLERNRQQFEVEQAKREAEVSIREENLTADRERFEKQLEFHEKRFTEEVGYLKGIVEQVLERLPDASIAIAVGAQSRGSDGED